MTKATEGEKVMRCDRCKHWDTAPLEGRRVVDMEVRFCGRALEWWEATEWVKNDLESGSWHQIRALKAEFAGSKMFVQDGSDYRADLLTAADFFCAHFEPKP